MEGKMSQQKSLQFTWDEALAEDVRALGGRKKLAPKLWPSEDEETAQDRLKAALSPGHKQQLKPSEVMRIKQLAREEGSTALVEFEAQELGYRIEWIDPVDEQAELQRDLKDLLTAVVKKQEMLERAVNRVPLKSVEGGRR
jgi:hypothetical protein